MRKAATKTTTRTPRAKAKPTAAEALKARKKPATAKAAKPRTRRNPAPRKTPVARAKKAFEAFTGEHGQVVGTIEVPDMPSTVWVLGEMLAVCYEATRDGITEQYMHEFKKSCRPLLCVAPDGKQLIVAGGRYTVTERGIEDMSRGKH